MKIKIDDNQLVLTDCPLEKWLFGLVFAGAGLQVMIPSLLSGLGAYWFAALFGFAFVYAGYKAGLSAVYQKVSINRWLKTVTIRKIGLFTNSKQVYSTDEIEKLYSETATDSENSKSYTICMTLKNDQSQVLGTPFSSKAECETVIKNAQTFLKQAVFPDHYQPKYL